MKTIINRLVLAIRCVINGHDWTNIYDDTVLNQRVMYRLCMKCGKIQWIDATPLID
jgi:hypothetical protein